MSTPMKSSSPVKTRLTFTILNTNEIQEEFTYPNNYLGCHITKLYGNDTIINVISTTLENIQTNYGNNNQQNNNKFSNSRLLSMIYSVQQILKQ